MEGQPERSYVPPDESRHLDPVEYDAEVHRLGEMAAGIESNLELLASRGVLDEGDLGELHRSLDDIHERLQALDARTSEPTFSEERHTLMAFLNDVRRRYPRTMFERKSGSALSSVRAMHRQVKAQYASVQHTLTDDRRRAMRMGIAQFTSLVRQAEDEAWTRLFENTAPIERGQYQPPPPPEPPAPGTDLHEVRSAIQLAIARASTVAPTIARAALSSASPRLGMLGAIREALKLS